MAEKHVRYSEDVETLTEAWTFVLTHVDEFQAPSISIEAYTVISRSYLDEDITETAGYTVSIHGHVS